MEITVAIILATLSVLIGVMTNELAWCLLAGTAVWIGLQYAEFRKLRDWSRRPFSRPTETLTSWFSLAYEPFRMLTGERERTRRITSRLREVLALTEVIPDAVIILNKSGNIENLNTSAMQMLNISDQDIGLSLVSIVRNPDLIEFLKSDTPVSALEFPSPFSPDCTLEARRFDNGVGGKVVLVRDITELNRLLTMRQAFIANVSHELRTPLTVVSGYLEVMSDASADDAMRIALATKLNAPVARMQTLVEDLLLLTQLESSSATDEKQEVNMSQEIRAVFEEAQGLQTGEGQIQLRIESDACVMGVEKELYSVCTNLLGNAIRYSPEGLPIEISWTNVGDKARFAVTDQGVGIAQEHISRLTERFYRIDLAGARSRGGTGLGLAIVKHVLLRHESALEVESNLGQGSRFFCDLNPVPAQSKPAALQSRVSA